MSGRGLGLLASLLTLAALRLPLALIQDASADEPVLISGNERAAWEMTLLPQTVLLQYEFAIYVDGIRRDLLDVRCSGPKENTACTAPIPRLSTGRHTLQFVAVLDKVESTRSESLLVQVPAPPPTGGKTNPLPPGPSERPPPELGTDAAVLSNGRVLTTQRGGVVSISRSERERGAAALVLDDVVTLDGLGLLAVAAHPQFERNHYVYLGYTARSRQGGAVYRVVRTREVGDTLGEAAVILDDVPATAPGSLSLRFGLDGKLYVALADVPNDTYRRHPYHGTILRIEDDGSTPRDSQASSPIYVRGIGQPRGLAWTTEGDFWVADVDGSGCGRVRRIGGETIGLGCGVDPRGIAAVDRPSAGGTELWIGRSDRAGLMAIPASPGRSLRAQRVVDLQSSDTPVGCVVPHPDGGVLLCVDDGAGSVIRWP